MTALKILQKCRHERYVVRDYWDPANACVCGDEAEQRRELGTPFMRKHKKDVTSDTKLAAPWWERMDLNH